MCFCHRHLFTTLINEEELIMKKALSIFCAAAMCTGILAGCGNTGSTAETTPAAPAESVQADSQAAETPAADAADKPPAEFSKSAVRHRSQEPLLFTATLLKTARRSRSMKLTQKAELFSLT